ncbi:L-rhamnose-binding lectin CSL1 [Chanos chanos]|uniref:L-rhamnose-binding lectin CSL1 n=1 Tax=Chanos chanos TaxID=29144 RepID=A0A6J2USS9_CHACN|nr:L-rhamnose-binding lectin CSL1-like [Chanos chanos]
MSSRNLFHVGHDDDDDDDDDDDFRTEGKRYAACEGQNAHLSCGWGVIKVTDANYGRTDTHTCSSGRPSQQISHVHCFQSKSLSIMSYRCDGKESCVVHVSNSVFSDPCYGTYKYLDVSYLCLPYRRSITCERATSTINCGNGVIFVHHANYGRRDLSICPGRRKAYCYNPKTQSLRSMCNGKTSCVVSALNSLFSDPCGGVYKYLEVTYSCATACEYLALPTQNSTS